MARVTLADMRACGYCARGARDFAARYGFDWASFLSSGTDADSLRAIGENAMVEAVIAEAERRERGADV